MIENIFPPETSLKNLVMNTLLFSDGHNGLSVIDIKKDIKNKHGVSATYQGINKILNSLNEERIVQKKKNKWCIEIKWVENIKKIFEQYKNKECPQIYTKEMKSISFTTIGKAFEFMSFNIEADTLRNNGKKVFIMHVKNIAFFGPDKKQMEFLKKFAKSAECHILVEKNNFINRLVGKYLKSIGYNVYIGVQRSTPHTITIYGNTLYNTFGNLDLSDYMTSMYENIKNISNLKAINVFDSLKDDKRFSIKFTFETDKEIVDQTKEFLLKIAKNKII
ncbi:hypothetical protein J4434_04970 [Candidatus Woesearchaeota archaeon]|nr:hypothetical protein [Candidatus Woesearchaeota archaeon]